MASGKRKMLTAVFHRASIQPETTFARIDNFREKVESTDLPPPAVRNAERLADAANDFVRIVCRIVFVVVGIVGFIFRIVRDVGEAVDEANGLVHAVCGIVFVVCGIVGEANDFVHAGNGIVFIVGGIVSFMDGTVFGVREAVYAGDDLENFGNKAENFIRILADAGDKTANAGKPLVLTKNGRMETVSGIGIQRQGAERPKRGDEPAIPAARRTFRILKGLPALQADRRRAEAGQDSAEAENCLGDASRL